MMECRDTKKLEVAPSVMMPVNDIAGLPWKFTKRSGYNTPRAWLWGHLLETNYYG